DAYFASSQYQLSTTVVAGILQTGPVSASAQPGSSSFLRFFNTGTAAGTITATLRDSTSARQLGQWTSPSIPAGAELQYPIGVLESAAGLAPGAGFYALSLQSDISGSFQHVLYRPANGALTNLSTCYEGVAADPARLAGVHSSLLADYPSAIVLNSAYPAPQTVNLGVYDARNGVLIGTYASGTIPGYGQLVLPVKTIETAIGKAPAPGLLHYVVKIDAAFSDNGVPRSAFIGNLQHLVSNTLAGVVTDMTTTCTLDGAGLAGAPTSPLRAGPIFSSAQTASQSYLRFLNGGITEGFVIATLTDSATGQSLGRWVSPGIRPGAESQFAIATIESAIGTAAKPANYGLALETTITSGAFQHVLFRPADGTLTNLSTCYASVTADPARAAAVHTSLVGALGYPSAIAVTNTGAVDEAVRLGLYDARFGNRVGAMTTAPIPAHGQLIVDVAAMEAAAAVTPTAGMSHYVVKAEGAFTGFLQHLVTNSRAGVVTDMSAQCVLPSPASPDLTYTLSTATAGNGAGTVTLTPYGTTGPGPYRFGTIVGVSATPAAGSVFAGFSGDCPLPGYSFDSCQLTMKGNYAVTAVFNLAATPDTYLLTVTPSSAAGGLGTVTSSSGGIDCSAVGIAAGAVTAQAVTAQAVTGACNARLAPGTRVTLTASPAQGSRFERWSTACENGPATAPTCVVTMNTNRYLPVSFGVAP
ncbi:MAG: hypothetical protein K1X51_17010, partial [Rhodospirillaceae bacterium]|nr:hypothetical protein [Rhodospirillaceae bacterium]